MLQVGPGIGVEVECVIDSGAVGVSKPDPRIFQIALDAIGVAAADAWYVGDMPGIDVVGARAAGLWPIVMDPFGFQRGADYARVDLARRGRGDGQRELSSTSRSATSSGRLKNGEWLVGQSIELPIRAAFERCSATGSARSSVHTT